MRRFVSTLLLSALSAAAGTTACAHAVTLTDDDLAGSSAAALSGITFGDWTLVPGGGTTHAADTAVSFNGKLYVFGIGINDHGHYVNVFDGASWTGWAGVPSGALGNIPSVVADGAVSYGGKVYLFGIHMANRGHYMNTFDGASWSGWTPVPGGGTTLLSDSATVYDGKLYVVGLGIDDHNHYVKTFDGTTWSGWSAIPGGLASVTSDGTASYAGKLYVFGIGMNDHAHYVNTFDGATWSGWSVVPGGGTTAVADSATAYMGKLFLFSIRQADGSHAMNVLANGLWSGWQSVAQGPLTLPDAAAVHNGKLYLFGIGSDSAHYVKVGTTDAPPTPFPPYNKVYGSATHNSYFVNRSDQVDYFASGTQELMVDQLLHDKTRALEIDVHSEGAPVREWKVYHTSDSEDFTCRYLTDCLEYLRNFHYAVPNHEAINVMIELKNVVSTTGSFALGIPTGFNFRTDHTQDDFDAIFRNALGSSLYTPADLLARCTPGSTMRDCAKQPGAWPTIDQLRGKFIVNLLGNWSTAAYDWTQYAASDMHQRVAFPMQTVFQMNGGGCTDDKEHPVALNYDGQLVCIHDVDEATGPTPDIDPMLRQRAFDASVFWQLEDHAAEHQMFVQQFLQSNGLVRGGDSFEFGSNCTYDLAPWNCQDLRVQSGFQFIQTNFPWHMVNDSAWPTLGIATDPSQRVKDSSALTPGAPPPAIYNEPGNRLYFQSDDAYPGPWAYATLNSEANRWLEATMSTTRHGEAWGIHTYNGIILDDYRKTCLATTNPEGENGDVECTSYPRATTDDGEGCIKVMSDSEAEGVEICRQKNTTDGASYYQESVDVYVRVFHTGRAPTNDEWVASRYAPCKRDIDPNSGDVSSTCVGSMLALAIVNRGAQSQVSVYSAGRLDPSALGQATPQWNLLRTETFNAHLSHAGFRAWHSELMAGVRMSDLLIPVGPNDWRPDPTHLRGLTLADLPGREVNAGSTIVDLSH